MSKTMEIISKLSPDCLYNVTGENYEDIVFLEGVAPFTKKEYQDALKNYDAWKAEQDAAAAQAKADLLERLGITADEAKLLLS